MSVSRGVLTFGDMLGLFLLHEKNFTVRIRGQRSFPCRKLPGLVGTQSARPGRQSLPRGWGGHSHRGDVSGPASPGSSLLMGTGVYISQTSDLFQPYKDMKTIIPSSQATWSQGAGRRVPGQLALLHMNGKMASIGNVSARCCSPEGIPGGVGG